MNVVNLEDRWMSPMESGLFTTVLQPSFPQHCGVSTHSHWHSLLPLSRNLWKQTLQQQKVGWDFVTRPRCVSHHWILFVAPCYIFGFFNRFYFPVPWEVLFWEYWILFSLQNQHLVFILAYLPLALTTYAVRHYQCHRHCLNFMQVHLLYSVLP